MLDGGEQGDATRSKNAGIDGVGVVVASDDRLVAGGADRGAALTRRHRAGYALWRAGVFELYVLHVYALLLTLFSG